MLDFLKNLEVLKHPLPTAFAYFKSTHTGDGWKWVSTVYLMQRQGGGCLGSPS